MKSILTGIIFLMFILPNVIGQQQDSVPDPDQLIVEPQTNEDYDVIKPANQKKFDVDMTVGTEFTFSPKNFYGPSYYIAPEFSYLVSPRFILSGGVGVDYARFYSLYNESAKENDILPMTRLFLYARGSYLLTPNLTVSGIAYKGINDVPRLTKYRPSFNYNYQGMGVGLNYKFSDSFSVGFEMRIQQNSYYPENGLITPGEYFSPSGY